MPGASRSHGHKYSIHRTSSALINFRPQLTLSYSTLDASTLSFNDHCLPANQSSMVSAHSPAYAFTRSIFSPITIGFSSRLACRASCLPMVSLASSATCAPAHAQQHRQPARHSCPTRCRPTASDPARSSLQGNARPRRQQGRLQYTLKQGTTTTYPAYIKTLSVPTLPGSYSYHIITQHKVGYINRDIHRADTHSIR